MYLPIYTLTGDRRLLFDGTEFKALFLIPHVEEIRFTYGLNVALGYNSRFFDSHALTAELRPIVGASVGQWRMTINPVIDTTLSGLSAVHFAPAEQFDYIAGKHWSVDQNPTLLKKRIDSSRVNALAFAKTLCVSRDFCE